MTQRFRKSFFANVAHVSTVALAATLWASSASALDLRMPKLPDLPDMPGMPDLNGNYYGGVGYGSSSIEPVVNESGFTVTDSASSGVSLFLGRDISRRFSVEGYYTDMGAAALGNSTLSGEINYSAMGASGLMYLIGAGGVDALASRRGFNVYGRLGFGKLNNTSSGIPFNRVNDWHWSGGFGAEYAMANGLGIRAEFNNFDTDARIVTLNLIKRFSYRSSSAIPLVERPDKRLDSDLDSQVAADTDKRTGSYKQTDKQVAAIKHTDTDDVSGDVGLSYSGVLEGVRFATSSSDLTQQATKVLDKVVVELKDKSKVKITVEAHTDNRGLAAGNMELSRNRAGAVVRYLLDGGIDLDRMSAIGYGESQPLESNRTAKGRIANRRVEIKAAK